MESPHLSSALGKSKRLLLLAIPVALLLTVTLTVVFSAHRALNYATQAAASEGQLAFTLRTLDPSSNLARSLGSETIASGPSYTTGAFLLGDLYLGGQAGLTIFRADGTTRLNLRSGFELPVAPINSIASATWTTTSVLRARLRDAPELEVRPPSLSTSINPTRPCWRSN